MPDNQLEFIVEPPFGWIVVNRPEARNALTKDMWTQLAAGIRQMVQDENIRVMILKGAGQESFISGADITELKTQRTHLDSGIETYHFTLNLIEAISTAPKPIIAMINGHCLGGGLLIALTCDIRIAGESSRFGVPASKLGVAYPPVAGVARLVQAVGATHATDILLSGRTFDAQEAYRMDLINVVTPNSELETTVRTYAYNLASNAPLSMAAHKLAIHLTRLPDWDETLMEDAVNRCYNSEDCHEGLSAFLEKRKPEFIGK